jgi:ornithine carbamoyltransferase
MATKGNELYGRNLLSIHDLSAEEIKLILDTAVLQKRDGFKPILKGKNAILLFEKPSLRTKVSFDIAMNDLGGHAVYLSPDEVGLGKREPVEDIARVTSRYASVIIARTFSHESLKVLAAHSTVPVVNALSDTEHPCQALADLLTIREHKKKIQGIRIAFVGDGNNVATSLALSSTLLGAHFSIASPRGYTLPVAVAEQATEYAKISGGSFTEFDAPAKAVEGADVVYTDVWTSMGQESEQAKRVEAFKAYCVTAELMSLASKDAIFMHDLPAHRGEEVAADVIDGPQSVVFDQAENRLHAQRALLSLILDK